MRTWRVDRLRRRPDRSLVWVPVGKWRAISRDAAIRKAARAIVSLAVLRAEPHFCGTRSRSLAG